jgi:hypothetical protein
MQQRIWAMENLMAGNLTISLIVAALLANVGTADAQQAPIRGLPISCKLAKSGLGCFRLNTPRTRLLVS